MWIRETEAHRSEVPCPRSHSEQVAELGFQPRLSGFKVTVFNHYSTVFYVCDFI